MARPMWKGKISFGLVTIPVSVVSGENKKQDLDFDLIDRRDHAHVGYQKINKRTGEVIDNDDIVKGLKLDSGKYAIFDQDELKKLRIKGSNTIDLQQFIDRGDVDPVYFKNFYYLLPDKDGQKTYVLLREILSKTEKFAVGLIVLHQRQQLVLIGSSEDALVLHTIHYAQEIKGTRDLDLPAPGLKSVKLNDREVDMAEKLVEELSDNWKPGAFKDTYIDQVRAAVKSKARKKVSVDDEAREETSSNDEKLSKVLDLMPLLEKSLRAGMGKKKAAPKRRAHARR